MTTAKDSTPPGIPQVGVGCIIVSGDRLLMVRNHRGFWSTPGGHLDFGESPEACAIRETMEETGIRITKVDFVAVTNEVMADSGRHYVTIWMRAGADECTPVISDPAEISQAGWFAPDELPKPQAPYFKNLIAGRSLPAAPQNMPFAARLRASFTG